MFESQVLDEGRGVVRHLFVGERPIDVGCVPMALDLDGDDLPGLGQVRQNLPHHADRHEATGKQNERFPRTMDLVIHLETVYFCVAALAVHALFIGMRCHADFSFVFYLSRTGCRSRAALQESMHYDQRCAISEHTQVCAPTIRRFRGRHAPPQQNKQTQGSASLARTCLPPSACFSFARMCYTGIRVRASEADLRAKATSAFRAEETGQREAAPLWEITREGHTMAKPIHQSVVCPILIGRTAEMAALQECIEATVSGQGGVVLLSGEAGIGKSRLVAELQRSAEALAFQLLGGQCFPADRSCPYAPLLDLLRAFLAPLSATEIARALEPSARVLLPLLPEQVQHLPELASLPPLSSLDPEQEQRRLFAALADVFTRAAGSRPVLLVVEDLHWSDESTLEFLLFFARKTVASRLLLLLTYRGEEVGQSPRAFLAQLDREHLRQDIALVPLTRAHTGTMLRTILPGAASLPAGMLDALYGLTEGNPFFLEEVLKTVLMAEELVKVDDGWRWVRAGTWRIPRSLQDAVELRLARVSADARRVLQLAAVAGRRFDFALLQQITQHDEASLVELMKEVIAAQLVIEEAAEQFAFRHALTQQAISGGLLARERPALPSRAKPSPRRAPLWNSGHASWTQPSTSGRRYPRPAIGHAGKLTRRSGTLNKRRQTSDGHCTPRVRRRMDTSSGRVSWTWACSGQAAITNGSERIFS